MSTQPSSVNVDDDGFRTSSSSSPQSNLFYFLLQNQNLPHNNQTQTLEDAFSLLSVSPINFNHPPLITDGSSALSLATKISSFNGPRLHPPQSSNLYGQMQESKIGLNKLSWNNISDADNAGAVPSQNSWVSWSNGGFLDSEPLVRQKGFGRGFLTVPLSNGGGDDELQQKPRGAVSNEFLGNRSNIQGFDVNGRSPPWFNNLWGRVVLMAKDQYGCRVLQEMMKRLTTEEVSFIFLELINHVAELMVEPFGNYVVQKLVEMCSEEQRTFIILRVMEPNFQLVRICLNPHGTRAVEKLLEHVTTQKQRTLIMSALTPGAVALATDINGHRVILHCLKYFSAEDNKYLLNVVANNCFGIATEKTGCCVLQHCVDLAQGETKMQLIAEIIVNASLLAEDRYGNYVVQHLVSLKIARVTECLLRQLEGKFLSLSCNKYGSNVVEKFFKESEEQHSTRIILELLHSPNVAMLLVDPYGNYVIKSALLVSKEGAIRNALLQLIQLNSPIMRSNLYGKKLLARFDRGKLRHT